MRYYRAHIHKLQQSMSRLIKLVIQDMVSHNRDRELNYLRRGAQISAADSMDTCRS